ncbi:MAG: phosphotransferase [Actinomycetota bacterium]
MHGELAERALATTGHVNGQVELLAEGMSSSAWTGVVDGKRWVVRVPKMDGTRPTPRYDLELRLLAELDRRGVPVMAGRLVVVDGVRCAVAEHCPHRGVREWNEHFVADVASAFTTLHSLDPLFAVEGDIVARLHLARSWPFDGSELREHPVTRWGADLTRRIERRRDEIVWAAGQAVTVAHTDLHVDHLRQDEAGRLAAVLDFGDAFAGSAGWDFASMRYAFGPEVSGRVLSAYQGDERVGELADVLAIPWALYKLDKTPERPIVQERVATMLGIGDHN